MQHRGIFYEHCGAASAPRKNEMHLKKLKNICFQIFCLKNVGAALAGVLHLYTIIRYLVQQVKNITSCEAQEIRTDWWDILARRWKL